MLCPQCKGKFRTVDARPTPRGSVRRVRICPNGHRYTTTETLDTGDVSVTKHLPLDIGVNTTPTIPPNFPLPAPPPAPGAYVDDDYGDYDDELPVVDGKALGF